MARRLTYRLGQLLVGIAIAAALIASIRATLLVVESRHQRVHSTEQHIADHIRQLGGAYHADGKNGYHISGVWLADTSTSDQDLAIVLELPFLRDLDVANTQITDASLNRIFSHKSIDAVILTGTNTSRCVLWATIQETGDRIYWEH